MKDFKEECYEDVNDSNIKFEEKGKSITFKNPGRRGFRKVIVDGCQIIEGDKCDYLLVDLDNGNEYFVELKGTDVGHALLQLDMSLKQLSDKDNKSKFTRTIIVATNCSPKLTAKVQKYTKMWKKAFGTTPEIKEKKYEVKV